MTLAHPKDLTIHPLLKPMPHWQDEDPRLQALIEDVRDNGILEPIKIDSHKRIVDGRHRWFAAKRLQLKEVPVVIIPDDQTSTVIVSSLIQRRHFSKGQRAYLITPFLAGFFDEAQARRLANLRSGQKHPTPMPETTESLAETFGFSTDLLLQARKLHKIFAENPKLRAQFEPEILGEEKDPKGLGGILAGIAGQESTKGKPKHQPEGGQLTLFTESLTTLGNRFQYWNKFNEEQREEVLPHIRQTVAAMSPELRAEFKKAILAVDKATKQQ